MNLSDQQSFILHKGLKACIKQFGVLDQALVDLIDLNESYYFIQRKLFRLSEVCKTLHYHEEFSLYDSGFGLTTSTIRCSIDT